MTAPTPAATASPTSRPAITDRDAKHCQPPTQITVCHASPPTNHCVRARRTHARARLRPPRAAPRGPQRRLGRGLGGGGGARRTALLLLGLALLLVALAHIRARVLLLALLLLALILLLLLLAVVAATHGGVATPG